jgi:protein Mpv17
MQKGYTHTLINNYKLWPAVQLINFYSVPLYYQTAFVNVIGVGWNAYLSLENTRVNQTLH